MKRFIILFLTVFIFKKLFIRENIISNINGITTLKNSIKLAPNNSLSNLLNIKITIYKVPTNITGNKIFLKI